MSGYAALDVKTGKVEGKTAKRHASLIARGVFTSVADLSPKLIKYLRSYAKHARPIRWIYTDPQRRISTKRINGAAH